MKAPKKVRTGKASQPEAGAEHLDRVRRICMALPETTEKISHGEPTFFVRKRVYCMFSNNHHHDGHIAVMVPTPLRYQATLLKTSPEKYYYPPYVGAAGWIGIELARISDEDLAQHLLEAWRMIEEKQRKPQRRRARA